MTSLSKEESLRGQEDRETRDWLGWIGFWLRMSGKNYFGNVLQSILPRPLSDHHPILLEGGGSAIRGSMPFRFENMWLKEEGFKGLIENWWKSFELSGMSSFRVVEKMKALTLKLKNWNKEIFGRVEERKIQAL